ncbi:Acetyltransferase (GNAT) domain-containing protein [Cribrihabitans marinus]|uniref:Acetyltransferase (GNAT) domain-containing protein n=1 Tax=Cribrihabitans marinus TaxID=1227549 RepID=A0A1H7CEI2_9RHOB|nr:GNAT family N-acetyltransferase [Cribrihabitans marinus]GGH35016.1 hypothetical protein GCM10010973_28060 [Cribrihabitans marinus]SEJ86987.1 Acetyltransferase (GNAT) domain-containing protein [Cribrihabitans marinus]
MMREAIPEDAAAMEAFLSGHPESSMFLRGNLMAHGIGERVAPHGTRFFLWMGRDGIAGVFGLTNNGYLMCQVPGHEAGAYAAFAFAIAGETVAGMTGVADQVAATLAALGLRAEDCALHHDEPLCRLDLSRLDAPTERLRPSGPDDEALLRSWFRSYLRDTGIASDNAAAADQADARAQDAARDGSIHLLEENGHPIAMAAINARVADMVQVGGVFVPQEQRNRGLGRRITAALLASERDRGARSAILFANNPAADRAYSALGFERVGDYRIALLPAPVRIGVLA